MLKSLQACRAVAAILVVLYHTSHGIFFLPKYFDHKPFGPVFDFGYAGVDFFFVLSGFIMMHVHAADIGQPRAIMAYLWKRFTRIYPAYWAVLLAIVPVYFLVPQFGKGHETELDVIWRAVLLFPHPESNMVLGVAWTLVYEIFFYLLFGLLILHRPTGLVVLFAWGVGVLGYAWFESYPWTFLFSFMHLRFLAGVVVALIVPRLQMPWPRCVALLGALLFVGAGLCDAYAGPLSLTQMNLTYPLGSAMMVLGLVQAEQAGLVRTPRWLVYLGDASYAIYLVHFLALSILAKLSKVVHLEDRVPLSLLFVGHVVGAIVIGCVFHHLIEKPLHGLTKRYFQRSRPAKVEVASAPMPPLSRAA